MGGTGDRGRREYPSRIIDAASRARCDHDRPPTSVRRCDPAYGRPLPTGSDGRVEPTEDGPRVVLGEAVALLDPFGRTEERRAVRARLQAAYDAAAPFEYPLVPATPVASPRLTAFEGELVSPRGEAWTPFSYGAGSDATAKVEGGAVRVAGSAKGTYSGAGAELALGTPDETADLSAYDGVEIEVDVAEGAVVVQFTSSRASVVDLPFAEIGETAGRVRLRLPWSAFGQRTPTPGWEANASAVQVLVRGRGEQATAFDLYDVRALPRVESSSAEVL